MIVKSQRAKKAILASLADEEMVKILDSLMFHSKSINDIRMSTRIVSNTNTVAAIVQKNLTLVSIEPDAADLGDKAFNPSIVDINVGDTIVWTNNDPVIHTKLKEAPHLHPYRQSDLILNF